MNWYGIFQQSRHGGSILERSIWYHGTREQNLPSIMSQGLIVEPKEQAWAEDSSASFMSPSRKSLSGIYLTQNLMTAISSASKNRTKDEANIIVITEVQPRSLVIDEDDVSIYVQKAISNFGESEFHIADLYMSYMLGTNQEYIEKIQKSYMDHAMKFLFHDLKDVQNHPELIERIRQIVAETWEVSLRRQATYAYRNSDYEDFEWRRMFSRNTTKKVRDDMDAKWKDIQSDESLSDKEKETSHNKYVESFMPLIPDPSEAEAAFASQLDKLTRAMKNLARPALVKNNWNPKARCTTNIGFSGSNKIIGIVRIDPKIYHEVEVLYGIVPDDFMKQWKKRVGAKLELMSPNQSQT